MYELIYTSKTVAPWSTGDLDALLEWSRERNADFHITGMLLYRAGTFMQLLEGRRADVESRFEVIRHDRRHRLVNVLFAGPIVSRSCPDWSMGFARLADDEPPPRGWAGTTESENGAAGAVAAVELMRNVRANRGRVKPAHGATSRVWPEQDS